MKRTLRTLGLLIITVLLTLGLAQQTQQTEQTQQMQQPQTTQDQRLRDMRMSGVLMELRQMHDHLGRVIAELEQQVTVQELEAAVIGLERGARASALRAARSNLRNLRNDIEAGVNPEEMVREIRWISYILNRAFVDVTGEERERIAELAAQLQILQEQVLTGAAEAQTTFEETLTLLDDIIARGQQEFEREGRRRAIQTAGQRLESLRGDIEGGRDRERVAGEIGQVRTELERAFQDTREDVQQLVEGLFQELRTLEEQVGAGSEEARGTLNRAAQQFQQLYNQIERQ